MGEVETLQFGHLAEGAEASFEVVVTTDDIDRFAALTGDISPLHMDANFARSRGFEDRVAHGGLLIGFGLGSSGSICLGATACSRNARLDLWRRFIPDKRSAFAAQSTKCPRRPALRSLKSLLFACPTDRNARAARSRSVLRVLPMPPEGCPAFDEAAQQAFATLSGDFNPQHVDEVAARRMLYGGLVMHPVHVLMRVLDQLAATDPDLRALTDLRVTFSGPVHIGDCVSIGADRSGNTVKISGRCGTKVVLKARLTVDENAWAADPSVPTDSRPSNGPTCCVERSDDDIEGLSGEVPIHLDRAVFSGLFPHLSDRFALSQAAVLLATSRLVGMECPGRNSIYAGLKLAFNGQQGTVPWVIRYQVTDWQPRFRKLEMTIDGYGARGSVEGFLQPPRAHQASMSEIRRVVGDGEFQGQRALVIGGSRGLGEVAAKVVAAGGGSVVVTYHLGRNDGERVVDELVEAGCSAACMALNVLDPVLPSAPPVGGISHVYYFASPHIVSGASRGLDPVLLRRYLDYPGFPICPKVFVTI